VLIQGILVENPYYIEPDEFLSTASPQPPPTVSAGNSSQYASPANPVSGLLGSASL